MADKVLKTSADSLYELVKSRKKISVEEAAKLLNMPEDAVHNLVDFLVEEKIFGIEYKFTTPYVYINEKHETEETKAETSKNLISKKEFFEKAEKRKIPEEKIKSLWKRYLEENTGKMEKEFFEKAEKRKIPEEKAKSLWKRYYESLQ